MYVLYGAPGSGAAAVEAALVRACAPCRVVHAASWEPQSALDELRQLNPLVQVPTLVLPDGGVMTESAAILVHLGLAHPGSPLLPADAAARAQAIRGLVFVAANCYAAIGVIDFPERWTDGATDTAREAVRRAATARLHAHWEVFADVFGAVLRVDDPGALELLAAVVSRWSATRPHLAARRPALLAALQRVEHHPEVAPVFERHWPARTP